MNKGENEQGKNEREEKAEKSRVTRRDFISAAGAGLCAGGIGLALLGTLRAGIPSVLPDPSEQFKIGNPGDFAAGTVKSFDEEKAYVFRDSEGLYAISSICTHLGCVVTTSGDGFQCPCHGSRFSAEGKVIQGPAPQALPWYEVVMLPDGQLVVDRGKPVKTGTKFKFEA